jgi:hypothetical protein
MGERLMNDVEKATAKTVFGNTIPYDNIHLSSGLGAGNRPFTIPDPLRIGDYMIYIGPQVKWNTLIHELSHVWQGYNSNLAWGYTLDSLFSQMVCKDAYAYKLGDDWRLYNVEQQASIVEHWYVRGRSTTDEAYRYIRDNVLHPERTERFTSEDFDGIMK